MRAFSPEPKGKRGPWRRTNKQMHGTMAPRVPLWFQVVVIVRMRGRLGRWVVSRVRPKLQAQSSKGGRSREKNKTKTLMLLKRHGSLYFLPTSSYIPFIVLSHTDIASSPTKGFFVVSFLFPCVAQILLWSARHSGIGWLADWKLRIRPSALLPSRGSRFEVRGF